MVDSKQLNGRIDGLRTEYVFKDYRLLCVTGLSDTVLID